MKSFLIFYVNDRNCDEFQENLIFKESQQKDFLPQTSFFDAFTHIIIGLNVTMKNWEIYGIMP